MTTLTIGRFDVCGCTKIPAKLSNQPMTGYIELSLEDDGFCHQKIELLGSKLEQLHCFLIMNKGELIAHIGALKAMVAIMEGYEP
jgi:hypothetical protein